jgi:hypothetical protein
MKCSQSHAALLWMLVAAISATGRSVSAQSPQQVSGFPGADEAMTKPFDGGSPIAGIASGRALDIQWEVVTFFASRKDGFILWSARQTLGDKLSGHMHEEYTDTKRCPGLEVLLREISSSLNVTSLDEMQGPNGNPPPLEPSDVAHYDVWISEASRLPRPSSISQPLPRSWVHKILATLTPCWRAS